MPHHFSISAGLVPFFFPYFLSTDKTNFMHTLYKIPFVNTLYQQEMQFVLFASPFSPFPVGSTHNDTQQPKQIMAMRLRSPPLATLKHAMQRGSSTAVLKEISPVELLPITTYMKEQAWGWVGNTENDLQTVRECHTSDHNHRGKTLHLNTICTIGMTK